MIYQYFYGREKDGYQRQLGIKELGLTGRDMEPLDTFAVYRSPGRMDETNLPECFYFYNAKLEKKTVGVVGKTSKVKAQTSQISGDRDTSFFHKYIFDGNSYKELLESPQNIFIINRYCTKLDDVSSFQNKEQNLYFNPEHNNQIPTLNETLAYFSINKAGYEPIFYNLLYGILNSEYKTGCKTYMILPDNSKEATGYAMAFMEYIYTRIPEFFIKDLGFTTYSVTFHDVLNNPLPLDVSMVFVADTQANRKRLQEVAKEHFLFVPDFGMLNEITMDQYTYSFVKRLGDSILNDKKEEELETFLQTFSHKVFHGSPLSLEFITASYEFYLIKEGVKSNRKGEENQRHLLLVLKQLFSIQVHMTIDMERDLLVFLAEYLDSFDISKYMMNLKRLGKAASSAYFNRFGQFDRVSLEIIDSSVDKFSLVTDVAIHFLADRLKGDVEKKNIEDMTLILSYEYQTDLLNRLVHHLYSTKVYYGVASKMVSDSLQSVIKADKYTSNEKTDKICRGMVSLSKQYLGLLKSPEYINLMGSVFEEILLSKATIQYDDIYYFRQKMSATAMEHDILEEYVFLINSILESSLQAIDWENGVDGDIIDQLYQWDRELLKQMESPLGQKVYDIIIIEDYRRCLEDFSIQKIVPFIEHKPFEEFMAHRALVDWKHEAVLGGIKHLKDSNKKFFYQYMLMTGYDVYLLLKEIIQKESVEQTAILIEEIEEIWKMGYIKIETEELTQKIRIAMVTRYKEGELVNTGLKEDLFLDKFGLEDLKVLESEEENTPVERKKIDSLLGKFSGFGKKK